MNLQDLYQNFRQELNIIEEKMKKCLMTKQTLLYQSSLHPLEAGGKRLRPLFVLLSGHFGKYDFSRLINVAVAVELIHMATLVHDDVIDNATLRRGKKTVKSLWDDQVALITGDYIFSRALEKITKLENPLIHQIFSKTLLNMCKGEIVQYRDLFNKKLSLKDYLLRLRRKTAILFAVSCQLGALCSESNSKIVRSMYTYGYCIGMTFQLIDDILDFTGEEKVLGKPIGSDLRQGNVTLPVIYVLKNGDHSEIEKINTYLDSNEKKGFDEILSIVKNSGGIKYTKDLAKRYLHKAEDALHVLPQNTAKQSLSMLTKFLLCREY